MEVNFMLWLDPNTHSRARLHCTEHKNNLSWLGYVAKSFNHHKVLFYMGCISYSFGYLKAVLRYPPFVPRILVIYNRHIDI